jgi:hypothetical protein
MSKTKRSLPEDFSVLTGTEQDGTPELHDIPQEYVLMNCIDNDITNLRDLVIAPNDAKELRRMATKLTELADEAERPF